jgi:cholesterol transport system auxiliary component
MRGSDAVFEKRRFEARVPVAKIDAEQAGPALSQAANQVAAQVADWVGK